MTFKELLAGTDLRAIVRNLVAEDAESLLMDDRRDAADGTSERIYAAFVKELLAMEAKPSDMALVGFRVREDSSWYVAVSAYEKEKLFAEPSEGTKRRETDPIAVARFAVESGLDDLKDELRRLLDGAPEAYGVVMTERAELLGMEVFPGNVLRCGKVAFVTDVLRETSFFGIDEQTWREYVEETQRSLLEAKAEVESGNAKTCSLDEAREELGLMDPRTPEEKEADAREILEDAYVTAASKARELDEMRKDAKARG